MHFENEFDIAATPLQVLEVFRDPRRVAAFLAGAEVGDPDAEGRYPALLTVSFGPKRIGFKGSLTHECDSETMKGWVLGRASADLRGAKMSVELAYQLSPRAEGTHVVLLSDAELTGMLAEFARTGGVFVARALIDDFAIRLGDHFRVAQPVAHTEGSPPQPAVEPRRETKSLSFFVLLRRVLKTTFFRRNT